MARKRGSAPGGAATPATRVLGAAGVAFTLRTYEHDSRSAESYGHEAATALGVDPARVFKTLVARVDGDLTVGVVPVTGQLDLKSLARACGGSRAEMAQVVDAERATGYVAGGISPLGQRRSLPTVVDASAREHATILVSGGRRGLDVELAPEDLVRLCLATVAAIAR